MAKAEAGQSPPLPLSPPLMPPNVKPEHVDLPRHSIMSRRGVGNCGRCISLLTNHFKVSVNTTDAIFYQYTVCLDFDSFLFFISLVVLHYGFGLTYHL